MAYLAVAGLQAGCHHGQHLGVIDKDVKCHGYDGGYYGYDIYYGHDGGYYGNDMSKDLKYFQGSKKMVVGNSAIVNAKQDSTVTRFHKVCPAILKT